MPQRPGPKFIKLLKDGKKCALHGNNSANIVKIIIEESLVSSGTRLSNIPDRPFNDERYYINCENLDGNSRKPLMTYASLFASKSTSSLQT